MIQCIVQAAIENKEDGAEGKQNTVAHDSIKDFGTHKRINCTHNECGKHIIKAIDAVMQHFQALTSTVCGMNGRRTHCKMDV